MNITLSLIFSTSLSMVSGGIAAFALIVLYNNIKSRWPESYTSLVFDISVQVRTNPVRSLILFRAAPVFIVVLFLDVMVGRFHGNSVVSIFTFLVIYIASTYFLAIAELLKKPRHPNYKYFVLNHVINILVVALSAILSFYLAGRLSHLVPSTKDIMLSMWSGLFAALFIGAFRYLITPNRLSIDQLINSLIKDIGRENWDHITDKCGEDDVLLAAVRAIVLTEVQQRPRWFRRIERAVGKIRRSNGGTYGVAQSSNDPMVTDKESINIVALALEKNLQGKELDECDVCDFVRNAALSFNNDSEHAERTVKFFCELKYNPARYN